MKRTLSLVMSACVLLAPTLQAAHKTARLQFTGRGASNPLTPQLAAGIIQGFFNSDSPDLRLLGDVIPYLLQVGPGSGEAAIPAGFEPVSQSIQTAAENLLHHPTVADKALLPQAPVAKKLAILGIPAFWAFLTKAQQTAIPGVLPEYRGRLSGGDQDNVRAMVEEVHRLWGHAFINDFADVLGLTPPVDTVQGLNPTQDFTGLHPAGPADTLDRATSPNFEPAFPQGNGSRSDAPVGQSGRFPLILNLLLLFTFITQFPHEALGLGAPLIATELSQGFSATAYLGGFSMLTFALGSLLGGIVNEKIDSNRAYTLALAARAVIIGVMTYLLAWDALSASGLVLLFSLDYLFLGIHRNVESSLPADRLKNDISELNRFGMYQNLIIDGIGFLGPILAAIAIKGFGFTNVFWAFPILFAVTAVFSWLGMRARAQRKMSAPAQPQTDAGAERLSIKQVLERLWSSRVLRSAIIAYSIFYSLNIAIYFTIAPAFGYYAAQGNSNDTTALVTALLTGANAAGGGMLGPAVTSRITRLMNEKSQGFLETSEREAAKYRIMLKITANLIVLSAVGLLGFWALALSTPILTVFTVPIHLAYILMLPLGLTQSAILTALMTLIQHDVPKQAQEKSLGFIRFFAIAMTMGVNYLLGFLLNIFSLGAIPSSTAFLAINIAITFLALFAALMAPSLSSQSKMPRLLSRAVHIS